MNCIHKIKRRAMRVESLPWAEFKWQAMTMNWDPAIDSMRNLTRYVYKLSNNPNPMDPN